MCFGRNFECPGLPNSSWLGLSLATVLIILFGLFFDLFSPFWCCFQNFWYLLVFGRGFLDLSSLFLQIWREINVVN